MQRICSVKIGMNAKITLDRLKASLARKGLRLTKQQVMELALEYSSENLEGLVDHLMGEEEGMRKILASPKHWGADTSILLEKLQE